MATRKSNEAKITIWTDKMKSDMSGTISGICIETFGYIMAGKTKSAAENREAALKLMHLKHEQLKAEGL